MSTPYEIYELYKKGEIYPERMPSIALELISNGFENETLVIVAGLSNPRKSEIDDLIEDALEIKESEKLDDEKLIRRIVKEYEENTLNNSYDIIRTFRVLERIHEHCATRWVGLDHIVNTAFNIRHRGWQAGDWETIDFYFKELKKNLGKASRQHPCK